MDAMQVEALVITSLVHVGKLKSRMLFRAEEQAEEEDQGRAY